MFRIDNYVEAWAQRFAALSHDPTRGSKNKRMYRMDSIMRNEEFAANLANAKSPSVAAVTQFDGAVTQGAKFITFTHRIFFMVKQTTNSINNPVINEVAAADAKEQGVEMAMKFLAYMQADKMGRRSSEGRPAVPPNPDLAGLEIDSADIVTDPVQHNGWWFTELLVQHTQSRPLCVVPTDYLPYDTLRKVAPYLYETTFSTLDYPAALAYFKQQRPDLFPALCSSFRKGDLYGRKLDWFYGNTAEFVVRTPSANGLHATLGIAGGSSAFEEKAVDDHKAALPYHVLPFYLLDGRNDAGVFANTNVVPTDKGVLTKTVPLVEQRKELCTVMLVRFILDHFDSARAALEYIRDYVAVYAPATLQAMGYEAHIMVGDAEHTYVLEFVDNAVVWTESSQMTNFHLHGVTPSADGTVYTPADVADGNLPSSQGVTSHGSGLERWNIIARALPEISSEGDAVVLLNRLNYTNAYKEQAEPWYSEFVGDSLTVDSEPQAYADIMAKAKAIYAKRRRDTPPTEPRTWQSTHTSLYDLATGTLRVSVQEEDEWYEFTM